MEMLNNVKLILFAIPLLLISVTASQAVVSLVDSDSSGLRQDIDNNITSGLIATGSGLPGDFEVIMCSTFSDGNNSFLAPDPGDWSTLDSGECGGDGQCILGIFGRFDESSGSTDISCNWTDPANVFAAGSFRYRGVDADNPVIDTACNNGGPDSIVTAPSVITEPGSAVIIVFTFAVDTTPNPPVLTDQITEGGFSAAGISQQTGEFIVTGGMSSVFPKGGPTGDLNLGGSGTLDWRVCTIALRMAPTEIPTLSEWGLGIFVALTAMAAAWALRRRSVRPDYKP